MKSFIVMAALFVSAQAYACPQLAGVWTCVDSTGKDSTVTVSQQNIPDGVLYTETDTDGTTVNFPADGKTRSGSSNGMTATLVASCQGNTVTATESFSEPSQSVKGTMNMSITLTAPGKLTSKGQFHIEQTGKPAQDGSSVSACTLNH